MKAVVVKEFGLPEVMNIEERTSAKPKRGQVLIAVKAAGVNPVDTYIRSGTYPMKPELPYTPGFDAAGRVIAVGSKVTKCVVGDSVYVDGSLSGTYAEEALCLEEQVHQLPEGISFLQGAALGIPYATAYRALFQKGKAWADQTVLIHGASGAVGVAAVQLAKEALMQVIGTVGSKDALNMVQLQGADCVFNHSKDGYQDKIMAATEGRGVDIIIEMLANKNLDQDFQLLAPRGRIIVVGCRGDVNINPRVLMSKDASVHGMVLFNATDEEREAIDSSIFEGLQNGSLKPVIGKQYVFNDVAQAHHDIIEKKAFGKVVLVP